LESKVRALSFIKIEGEKYNLKVHILNPSARHEEAEKKKRKTTI
jgi:hypothetical protein